MPAPAFSNFDLAFPSEFLRAKAVVATAMASMAPTLAAPGAAVELLRYDLVAGGGPIGGTRGGFIKGLIALPRATVAAGRVFLFSSLDGAALELRGIAAMAAYDSTQVSAYNPADFGFSEGVPRRVSAGERWFVGASVALGAGIAFEADGDGFG